MTKEDFIILRNSITMRQLTDSYGFNIDKRGFVKCPFHDSGSERTPSLQVFRGYRGFYCRACGTGGDVTKFVELYEGVTTSEAAMLLSDRFGIPISETGEVPEETRLKAQQAVLKQQRQLSHQQEVQADLRPLGTHIGMLKEIISDSEPFGTLWNYCQNELPKAIGEWEEKFAELRKV